MMHWFVDTNVLLDFLTDRQPFAEAAQHLFLRAHDKQVTLYVASLSFSNAYYLMRQTRSHPDTSSLLADVRQLTTTIAVDDSVVEQALNSTFKDFEDALQYFAAKSAPAVTAIITRNQKDFKASTLPVLTPQQVLLTGPLG